MKKLLSIAFMAILFTAARAFSQDNPKRIEAERFSETNRATTKESSGETVVNKFDKGAWIRFDKIDFGKGVDKIKLRAGSGSKSNPQIEIRLGDHRGKLLGKVDIESKGWGRFNEHTLQISKTKGKQSITIVSTGGGVLLDWFEIY